MTPIHHLDFFGATLAHTDTLFIRDGDPFFTVFVVHFVAHSEEILLLFVTGLFVVLF